MARQAVRRIPPPRTLLLDSADEVAAFRQALRKRWTLPHVRVALRLPRLPESRSNEHERQINRLLMATGYREGLAVAALLAIASLVWLLLAVSDGTLVGMATWAVQLFLAWVLGWHVGRLAGIARVRHRVRALLAAVLDEITRRNSTPT